jgi:glycosyltransferase involved in cell wall biosynthesis
MGSGRRGLARSRQCRRRRRQRNRAFELHDVAALAASIQRLLMSPATMRSMGRRARDNVVRRYTIEAIAGAYDAIYRRLVDHAAAVRN